MSSLIYTRLLTRYPLSASSITCCNLKTAIESIRYHFSDELHKMQHKGLNPPRLHLPAELRNQIYELVLVRHRIRLWYRRQEIQRRRLDEFAMRSNEFIHGAPFYNLQPESDHIQDLRNLLEPSSTKLTLLSPVCRQLYRETSLLVNSLNTFSFQSF